MKRSCTILILISFTCALSAQNKKVHDKKVSQQPNTNTFYIDYFSKRGNAKMTLYYTLLRGDSARNSGDLARAEKLYLNALTYTDKITKEGGPYHKAAVQHWVGCGRQRRAKHRGLPACGDAPCDGHR